MYSMIGDILIGLVSGLLVLIGDRCQRQYKLKGKYAHLEGRYEHYNLSEEKCEDWVTEIIYIGDGTFVTHSKSSTHEWKGQIVMNERIPGFGTGNYIHIDRSDCGLHQIQTNNDPDEIFVMWTNTSHAHKSPQSGTYLWRRIHTGKGK